MQIKNIFLTKSAKLACASTLLALGTVIAPPLVYSQSAQTTVSRSIPKDTFWGKAEFIDATTVKIEGRVFTYAPAVFIRNDRNLLITPIEAVYANAPPLVRFGINAMGQVDRIWFLTDQEREETLKSK